MKEIDLGRVIWADIVKNDGTPIGEHAAIILTTKEEYQAGKPIMAVVISSKLDQGKPEAMVEIRQVLKSKGGHPATGLSKRSAAMCDLVVPVNEEAIRDYRGMIYGKDLNAILQCVAANRRK